MLQSISQGWQSLMKLAVVVVVGLTIYGTARELSGRQTWADIRFSAIADLKANKYFGMILPWGLFGVAGMWAAAERSLRKKHIRRVSSEASEMQRKIDPGRRSSQLTLDGESRQEDI